MLSIIVPTCDRPVLLMRCVNSLLAQAFSGFSFELLIVDNSSSKQRRENFFADCQEVRCIDEPVPGLHNARHRGMREAKGEFLVFVDDDIEALPGWIEGVWHGFQKYEAVLVGGRNLPRWEGAPPAWLRSLWEDQPIDKRCLGYLSILDFGTQAKDVDPAYVWGCNFAIRKSVLLEAGGFHPDAMPDELLHFRGDGESSVTRFVSSRGYKSVYMPTAAIYHIVPKERMTVDYFRARAFRQGISDSYTRLRLDSSGVGGPTKGLRPLERLMGNARLRPILGSIMPPTFFLRANINQAYQDGFNWHRHCFLNDEQVRNWVLKTDYLEV